MLQEPPTFPAPPPPPPPPTGHEAEEGGLRRWGELTAPVQAHIMQAWMSGPWKRLTDFCLAYGLDYSSIHQAFSKRHLLETKKALEESGVPAHEIGRSIVSADQRALDYDRLIEAVLHLMLQQVLCGGLSLDKLMQLSQRLTTDRTRLGNQVVAAQAGGSPLSTTPAPARSQVLPPALRDQLSQRLAAAGEKLARKQEQQKHG